MGGHIDLTFDQVISALPYVRNGQIKAYAATANVRLPAAPDIPTVDEAGAPGVYMEPWQAIFAPKGTPRSVIDKLNAAVAEALADPELRKRLADFVAEIPPREQLTPEYLAKFHKSEIDKWFPIIKAAGIKAGG